MEIQNHTERLITKICDRTAVIAVIGLGYVGLPTAVAFAEKGFHVIGVDRNKGIIKTLGNGGCHLTDLDIEDRVKGLIKGKQIEVTTNSTRATERSDIILIIVPTPLHPDKTPNTEPVVSAGEDVGKGLSEGKLVILESTVYPGMTEEVLLPKLEHNIWRADLTAGLDFGLAHVPERYNPGDKTHSISDVVRVVGAINDDWLEVTSLLYKPIAKDVCKVRDIRTAEASKIIENVQRDLNIALMNELALIFERMDIDVMEVIRAAQTKWNFATYYPGAGVGGHCLTKDGLYLVSEAKKFGYHPQVILAGRAVNDSMPYHVLDLLTDALNEHSRSVRDSKVVVLGLSYKENIGDIRESPSIVLIEELEKRGARIVVVDPYIESLITDTIVGRIVNNRDKIYGVMNGADAVVLMTAHDEFRQLDLTDMAGQVRTPILIDGRRIFDKIKAEKQGFTYRGVGARNGSGREEQ